MIKINENIYINKDDLVSVQEEIVTKYSSPNPSDFSTYYDFVGSVMTMKNGRKIFVRGMSPKEIMNVVCQKGA